LLAGGLEQELVQLQHNQENQTGGALKTGGGQRATRQLPGAILNVLQTEHPVNGVVLREKKVP